MEDNWISVIDVANRHGKRKTTIFKILKRLEIKPKKVRKSSSKNQMVAYITQNEFQRVSELLAIRRRSALLRREDEDADDFISVEEGVFYLIQLEPKHDPGRFKVGFAANMSERLRSLRCSAPFASILKTWPCRRLWEKTAIECVSAGCERLHTEVFRAASLDQVLAKCDGFFAIMPPVSELSSDGSKADRSLCDLH